MFCNIAQIIIFSILGDYSPKNKLYSFSLPVHSKFSKYVDKIKAKKELNLNPNMNHIKLINIKF